MTSWVTALVFVVAGGLVALPVGFLLFAMNRRGLLRFSAKSRILQEERPSFTAELVTVYRAISNALGYCDDPFAYHFLDLDARLFADTIVTIHRMTGKLFNPRMVRMMATRTVYLDKFIRESKPLQVVILGAGLDARAFRMRKILGSDVKFFEVDAPATQKLKMETMRKALSTNPSLFSEPNYLSYVTFVSCDFSSESFLTKLEQHGFDKTNPRTVLIMEGVASYLTKGALEETLKVVGGLVSGTRFAMNIVGESNEGRILGKNLLKYIIGEERKNAWNESENPEEYFGNYGFQVLGARTFQDILENDMPFPKTGARGRGDALGSYIFTLQVK